MYRAFLIAIALLAPPAMAAELRVLSPNNADLDIQAPDPAMACTHRMTGTLGKGDADRMIPALENSIQTWRKQDQWHLPVLCLDSPGGSLVEALKLAALLRDMPIGTKLEANATCESACAMVFMAGSFHAHESGLYKWRIMHPTARLGFHAPSLAIEDGQYSAATVTRSYNLALETLALTLSNLVQNRNFQDGVHLMPSLMAEMLMTPADSMMYVDTVDQEGRWGIEVGPLRIDRIDVTEMDFRRACANTIAWARDEPAADVQGFENYFINYNQFDSQWADLEVIENDMTGEGCSYSVPAYVVNSKYVPLTEVNSGFVQLATFANPLLRLRDLPY
jgi:ATP-dependent protease ClpP protease subunit